MLTVESHFAKKLRSSGFRLELKKPIRFFESVRLNTVWISNSEVKFGDTIFISIITPLKPQNASGRPTESRLMTWPAIWRS
jgi:hypothetical protein